MVRRLVLLATGAILIAVSTWGYLIFIKEAEVKTNTMESIKPVRLLTSGEIIDKSMLRVVTINNLQHASGAITDIDAIVGKRVVVPIGKEEEILKWKLSEDKVVPEEGERYFSFNTDLITNVNNMVRRGDRVDVWVEFDVPKSIETLNGVVVVAAVKIIENLLVSNITDADGNQISDDFGVDAYLRSNNSILSSSRHEATGIAKQNTYIMTDEVYEAYVQGQVGGKIKLALPNINFHNDGEAQVTDTYISLKTTNFFSKTSTNVQLDQSVNINDVRGAVDERQEDVGIEQDPPKPVVEDVN